MENLLCTPHKPHESSCFSEPGQVRTPLSVLQNHSTLFKRALTPSFQSESESHTSEFILSTFEHNSTSRNPSILPLPLLVKPSLPKSSKDISEILQSLRSNHIKSILKDPAQPCNKNVTFSETESKNQHKNTTEIKSHSIATTTNSVTESRIEQIEENKLDFRYEEEIRSSLALSDIDEYPTVAYCSTCRREIVTRVDLEKVKSEGFSKVYWVMCWCLPACLYNDTNLVHRCSLCNNEIARIISN